MSRLRHTLYSTAQLQPTDHDVHTWRIMLRIFNPRCRTIQGVTQVQEYASCYPDAKAFLRLEQCQGEARAVTSCDFRECCLPTDSTEACQWQGHVYLERELRRSSRDITRELVGLFQLTFTRIPYWLPNWSISLIMLPDDVCTLIACVTEKRHFIDLLMLCTIRLCAYF
jgi:hypothetical protein